MLPAEFIKKKRGGAELSQSEIKEFINEYMSGYVTDYQMSAFLMSVYFRGMSKKEIWALTKSMMETGSELAWGSQGFRVDKHSTGGVGDKTSLVIGPIVAAAGLQVPMISGRGLGHTGGTLDKLESIPGFNVFLDLDAFKKQVVEHGLCFIGQTQEICPADKRMYALRDVTGTVECVPLICASIMSKKLAEGIDGLVLDVKSGSGAFMKSQKEAENLAKNLIEVGKSAKKKIVALVTDMSQPLGRAIGNALEVQECLDVLENKGPKDLTELSLQLSAQMILLGKKAPNIQKAYALAKDILESGQAMSTFKHIVSLQGGTLAALPQATHQVDILSPKKGYIKSIDAEKAGVASLLLGAGRAKADDKVDPCAGIVIHKKIGDSVAKGEKLATLYFTAEKNLENAKSHILSAYAFSLQKVKQPRLILKVMR